MNLKKTTKIFVSHFLLMILNCTLVYTQLSSLNGSVIDKISSTSIQGAEIILKSIDTKTERLLYKTISLKKGLFEFKGLNAGLYELQIINPGYNIYRIDSIHISPEIHLDLLVSLLPSQETLKEVIVSTKRPDLEISHQKISLHVAQSSIASSGSAYEAIQKIPGVIEQNDKLTFRSQPPAFYLNGRQLRMAPDEIKNFLNNIQGTAVEMIEILPEPGAKYDAVGGAVINIVLAKDKSMGTNYSVGNIFSVANYVRNTINADMNFHEKKITITTGYNYATGNQLSFMESERRLAGNGILNSFQLDNRSKSNHSYKFTIDYDLSKKTSIGFSTNGVLANRNRNSYNIATNHLPSNISDTSSQVVSDNEAHFNTTIYNAYLRKRDDLGNELSLNIDYLRTSKTWTEQFENIYLDPSGNTYSPDGFLRNTSPSMLNSYSIAGDFSRIVRKGRLELGGKLTLTNSDNEVSWEKLVGQAWKNDASKTNHFIYSENILALYGTFNGHIKIFTYSAGLRLEQSFTVGTLVTNGTKTSTDFINLFPTVSISYLGKRARPVSFSYRKSIIRFGFDFINPFIFYQNPYSYIQGNPELKPQLNHKFSASYVFSQGIIGGIDYTHSKAALGISYKSVGQAIATSYDNFNSTDILYGYINLNKTFRNIWNTNLSLAGGYLTVNNNTVGNSPVQQMPLASKPFGSIQINNTLRFGKEVSLELLLSGYTAITSGIFERKSFFTSDFGFSKNFLDNKISLKISLQDIFNSLCTKTYVDYQGINTYSMLKNESRILGINIKYRFGNLSAKTRVERTSKIEDIKNRINQ